MAYTYLLQLSGIEGDSEISGHEGEILVDSYEEHYDTPDQIDQLELEGEEDVRPSVDSSGVTITKQYSKSVPNILTHLVRGAIIKDGTLFCIGAEGEEFLEIKMTGPVVQDVAVKLVEDKTTVTINFSFDTISHTFKKGGETLSLFEFKHR